MLRLRSMLELELMILLDFPLEPVTLLGMEWIQELVGQ
jgi:hypothetical protein